MLEPTPRQRRRVKNFETILDAACDLIIEKGYENVSLREIASRADYSPAGLYKYFESKGAIMYALRNRINVEMSETLLAIPESKNPKRRLIELCMAYIQYAIENRAYLSLINNLPSERTMLDQPPQTNSPYESFYQAVMQWVATQPVTLPEDYGPEAVTYGLWAQIHGMATLRLNQLKDFKADFQNVNRLTVEIYLNGLENTEWE
jgi:AcrR family transcriptional regulator